MNCCRCWASQDEEKKLTLEYSHGMKKKLALAAAILPNPDLLFLDEPFEGVDAVTSRVIRDLLGRLRRPRVDGLSDFARPGNRRAALHARRHHRQGAVGRAGFAGNDSPGRLARRSLPAQCRSRLGSHAQAQLARGGRLVNWQHLQAFVWLRWRLLVNQWRRGGALNAVLMMIVAVGLLVMAIPLFVGCFVLGCLCFPRPRRCTAVCVGRHGRRLSVLLGHRPDDRAAEDRPAVAVEVLALARLGQRGVLDQLSQLAVASEPDRVRAGDVRIWPGAGRLQRDCLLLPRLAAHWRLSC